MDVSRDLYGDEVCDFETGPSTQSASFTLATKLNYFGPYHPATSLKRYRKITNLL